ncbi:neuropeptide Y receptor Y8b [Hemiscyllium ocellatum]|uniref:neuropeptide Y receptor Y8b n=1 Tax=Hemiscyllium ocellatum TaxID=170820 RepID=UPI002966E7BB|nr:neuropeptide Y receptor Y8b [Hemiscyllium ocellatum]XP_060712567.1 neuropeptide Y receptor Y8b [Hemiscyllium ocellatum]XP_060712568.1 neuropeptide Y receptor Y8b [Hemiscyllium ocellatum]XP_060712569.1 neuropeptide Y receptor Y8b [Hemiscyllium ocellatum]
MDQNFNHSVKFQPASLLNISLLAEQFQFCSDSVSSTTFLIVAYSAVMAVGMIGNMCLVLVIMRQKEMRNVTNILIANLSCSDILITTLCLPVTVIYTMMDHWILGAALCKLTPFVQCTSVTVSILSLVLIALERHQLIINPTGWKPAVGHAYLAVALSWLVGSLISLPFISFNVLTSEPYSNISFLPDSFKDHAACIESWPSEQHKLAYTTCLLVFQYGLPLLLMLTCYFRIFLRLRRRREMVDRARDGNRRVSHSRKINIMLASIVVAFGLCWLPLTVFNTVFDWNHEAISICHHNLIFSLCHLTAMLSTCVNPVIYGFLNTNFQKEVKAMLYRCRCGGTSDTYESFPLSTVNTELSKASVCH